MFPNIGWEAARYHHFYLINKLYGDKSRAERLLERERVFWTLKYFERIKSIFREPVEYHGAPVNVPESKGDQYVEELRKETGNEKYDKL